MQALMDDECHNILALWYIVNASLSAYYKLIDAFGSPRASLLSGAHQWQALAIHKAHIARLQDTSSVMAFVNIVKKQMTADMYRIIYRHDEAYPQNLNYIFDPPPLLFYQGDVSLLNRPQIAIVGTRKPSDYAKKITFDLASYLAQSGLVVTSGLADGLDAMAHQGALDCGCTTIGVMGTGIDVVYPKYHRGLFKQIVDNGGCLITELLPNTQAGKHTFPRRNRLVAGLSQATLVTEATKESGSLITARIASEQGKQVFVVPGQIDNPNSEGCHHLIREGATLIYHPNQILEELSYSPMIMAPSWQNEWIEQAQSQQNPPKQQAQKMDAQNNVFEHQRRDHSKQTPLLMSEPLADIYAMLDDEYDLDALVVKSQKQTGELLAILMELELLGLISQRGGRYVKL